MVPFAKAFGYHRKLEPRAMAEEETLMEELANTAEDEIPDDGAVEIDSDNEHRA
ncbi:hypothetical protein GGX14DRAFT_560909 [Mycena pura]|uniref:Uncharacterized protein n=1 Tax=Mycena pura TaxID=153505 RepID=A0AAD6VSF7_9AGAR|nr:hypothetical protein GGX14DRAFT_560909 [Mycena pura]